MSLLLSIHPVGQFFAIILAYYAAFLGLERFKSLHLGKPAKFMRNRHALVGSISLGMLLSGFAAGRILVARFINHHEEVHLHNSIANLLLPLLLVGLSTGVYMFLLPGNRKVLPAIHALNNLGILILLLAQIFTGVEVYQAHVLTV